MSKHPGAGAFVVVGPVAVDNFGRAFASHVVAGDAELASAVVVVD